MDNYKKRMREEEERASGIAPEETELDIALEDIIDKFIVAEEEHKQQKTDKKEKLESDSKKAAEMRNVCRNTN